MKPDTAPTQPTPSHPERMMEVPIARMESAATRAFANAGADAEAARRAAHEVVANELDGASAHGLQSIAELVDAIHTGDLVPDEVAQMERTGDRSWRVDGGRSFPCDIAAEVSRALIDGARAHGMASVAVTSHNSLGRLASIAAPVAEAGLLVLGFSRSRHDGDKVVAHGGRRGKLGSNPMVFAAPAGEKGADHGPVVVDLSTSAASEGEVRHRVARSEPVPEGWLIDAAGNPVRQGDGLDADPPTAFLLPLGGRQQGHKGFGLSLMVEILAGVLTGCSLSGAETEERANCAFFVALSPQLAGRDEASVRRDVLELTRHLQDVGPNGSGEASRVEIPGWAARELRQQRLVEGSMALPTPLWLSVLRLAEPRRESDGAEGMEAPPTTLTTAQVVASRRRRPRQPLTVPRIGVPDLAPPTTTPEAIAAFSRPRRRHPAVEGLAAMVMTPPLTR